jgi:hypothetical protein
MIFDAKLFYLSNQNLTTMSEKKKTPPDTSDEKYPEIKPYPAKDDIYNRAEEEQDIDPEDLTKRKARNEKPNVNNEESFEEDLTAEDLDVPGNKADEQDNGNGNEDEENNYYSLGADKKNQ